MRLTISVDYATRMVAYLATQDRPCSSKEISEQLNVSREYITQITSPLRANGIMDSVMGVLGGYRLCRDADDITMYDLVHAIEGELKINHCLADDRECSCASSEHCSVRNAYAHMETEIETVLKSITIGQIVEEQMLLDAWKDEAQQVASETGRMGIHVVQIEDERVLATG